MPEITKYPLNLLLDGVLWGFAMLFLFKAYEYIEASEATIITTLQSVFAIISALFFLGETFTLTRVIGTLLIIFSVVYVSFSSKKFTFNKGVLFALGFSLFGGLALTNDTYMLNQGADPLSYLIFVYGLPFIFMVIVQPQALFKMKPLLKPKIFSQIVLLSFLYGSAAIAFFLAIGFGAPISQLAPINQASVILTLLFSAILLGETDHMYKKLFCGVLVFIGVFLLT
jgi:drug/metabolite transporter (DMT)-like permease